MRKRRDKYWFYLLLIICIASLIGWIYYLSIQSTAVRELLIFRTGGAIILLVVSLLSFYYNSKNDKNKLFSKRVIALLIILTPLAGLITNQFISDPQLDQAKLAQIEGKIKEIDYRTRGIYTDEYGNTNIGGAITIGKVIDPEVREAIENAEKYQIAGKCDKMFKELQKIEDSINELVYIGAIECYLLKNDSELAELKIVELKEKYPDSVLNDYYNVAYLIQDLNFEEAILLNLEAESKAPENLKKFFRIQRQRVYVSYGLFKLSKCANLTPTGYYINWEILNREECIISEKQFNKSLEINEDQNVTQITKDLIQIPQDILNKTG